MSWTPFFLKRVGPRGADTHKHLFCAGAKGNPELVRTGETDAEVLINGASSSDKGVGARGAVQKLVDELNAVWERYLSGEFHDVPEGKAVGFGEMLTEEPPVAPGVVCNCGGPPGTFCPAHGIRVPEKSNTSGS